MRIQVILSDSDLLQALKQRDPAAFQQANDRFLPTLWRFVYLKVSGDQHVAEDIVSETMLALVQAMSDPELVIENIGGWLRGVASHKVNDYFRAASRVRHLVDDVRQNDSHSRRPETPDEIAESEERRVEVRVVMEALTEQYRLALEWKYLDKLSVRQIAARWRTTEKAVESILFRARREFRDRMEQRAKNVEMMSISPAPKEVSDSSIAGDVDEDGCRESECSDEDDELSSEASSDCRCRTKFGQGVDVHANVARPLQSSDDAAE